MKAAPASTYVIVAVTPELEPVTVSPTWKGPLATLEISNFSLFATVTGYVAVGVLRKLTA